MNQTYIPKFKDGDWVKYKGETWKIRVMSLDTGLAYALDQHDGMHTLVVFCEEADKSMYFA